MADHQFSELELLAKARNYCARQERSQQEVRDKVYSWGGHKESVEQIIAQLIGEGFLNEARFAEHYAVSKSRQKGWGRRKIEQALQAKRVSKVCIAKGLKAIDGDEQSQQLEAAVAKRWEKLKHEEPFIRKGKLVRYFMTKGFSSEEIGAALEVVLRRA
ncbi:MAG: regulatory protein RecX [Flavobacteriales bacterium]